MVHHSDRAIVSLCDFHARFSSLGTDLHRGHSGRRSPIMPKCGVQNLYLDIEHARNYNINHICIHTIGVKVSTQSSSMEKWLTKFIFKFFSRLENRHHTFTELDRFIPLNVAHQFRRSCNSSESAKSSQINVVSRNHRTFNTIHRCFYNRLYGRNWHLDRSSDLLD